MTVADLIAALIGLDPETVVIQSSDGEGNSKSPASSIYAGFYRPDTTWSGEFYMPLDDEDRASGSYSEEDEYVPEDGDVPAVCLWPTN
jgi:hypothetical protein